MASSATLKENSGSLVRTIALVGGSHIIMLLTDGATMSFGIYLTDLADELETGLGVTGAAISLLTSFLHFFSPVGTYLASKFGYRRTVVTGTLLIAIGFMLSSKVQEIWQLFFTHSAITGFGISLVFTNTITFVGMSCDNHIAIANGVVTAGSAVGLMTFPVLTNFLKEAYGWRGSLLILGSLALHATLLSLIIFRNESKYLNSGINETEYSSVTQDDELIVCNDFQRNESNKEEIRTTKEILTEYMRLPMTYPLFGFLIIVANLLGLSFSGTLNHVVASSVKKGIPDTKAAILLTIFGIGNIISRLLHGIPIKFGLITTTNLFAVALIVSCSSISLIPFCNNFRSLASVTLFTGISFGASIPIIFLSTREIVGLEEFPKAMSILLFTTGFSGVIGGFFTGWIFDISGSYNVAFFIMSSLLLLGLCLLIIPNTWFKYKQNRMDIKDNEVSVPKQQYAVT